MPNEFAVKPELPSPFPVPRAVWTDPITKLQVPKDPAANLAWRLDLLTAAEEDKDLQVDLYTACSQSLLFFVNAFVFTLRVFEPDAETGRVRQAENAHIPMVTWEIQDTHLLKLEHSVESGESLLTDKSRDMGATWNHMAMYVHRLLFRSSESHLLLSRKEDAVDILDGIPKRYPHGPVADPGTLFGKLDYVLSRLPAWMLPKMSRKKMHLVNLDNKCRIDGESANATAGSSDRRTSIFMDEMAKMKEGESIKRSTRDVTATRFPCSTPNGAGTPYSKWRMSGTIPVFVLPWWEHPEKGRGRYVSQDDLGRWKIRSPWYDAECEQRSPKEVAIEIDMDHVGSGNTFFEGTIIEEHRILFAREPRHRYAINFKKDVTDAEIPSILARRQFKTVRRAPKGPWKVWCKLIDGRPDQTKHYIVAADIGKGQGASNSTVSVMCNETGEKIASFADATLPPYEFAKVVVAACLWVGGRRMPLLIWENNGDPGFDFGRQVVHTYEYPNIYFARRAGTLSEKRGKRYGWRSDRESKAFGLGALRRAYAHGGFINHDAEALTETLSYIHYDDGGIGPAEMVEENSSARQCHGDRVIADMLCVVATEPVSGHREGPTAPQRSFANRMKNYKAKKRKTADPNRFDFKKRSA